MAEMKQEPSVATLIGDLVGSRTARDRSALHTRLTEVLDQFNAEHAPRTSLRIQAGDEYQGTFDSLGSALQASLWLRLALLPSYDVRHGIGWGPVRVLGEEPRVEDGPGWWAARDAIAGIADPKGRPGGRERRTSYLRVEGVEGPDPAAVEAYLMVRDTAVSGLSPRSLSVLRGLMAGLSQREIAERLGISPSAVSQRVRGDSLLVLAAADDLTGEVHQ